MRRYETYPFLELLFVATGQRRTGIGSALIASVEQQCDGPALFTWTNQSNTAMRAFLTGHGYEPTGDVLDVDVGDPDLVYAKRRGDRCAADVSRE